MSPLPRRALLRGGAAVSVAGLAAACSSKATTTASPTATPTPKSPSATPAPTTTATATPTPTPTASTTPDPQVAGELVTGLAVPWGIAFLPGTEVSALVGERDTGRLLRVTDGSATPVATLAVRSRLDEAGETGLLGLALHPDFASNGLLYAYLSTDDDNRVVRMTYDGTGVGGQESVLTGIATSTHHNGGGLVFGPDGMLYAATGDAEDQSTPQDTDSLNGKVLRMTDAGKVPDGNPFGNLVWSYGHRNVEGLAFDEQGRLWASEFGDKAADELNQIEAGGNYGWPAVEGASDDPDYTDPLAQWPVADCSPSGIAVTASRAWLGALQGECVWSVVLDGARAGRTERHLAGDHGRLRSVHLAPDGSLWVTTSNRDGRTDPRPGDDRILRVVL